MRREEIGRQRAVSCACVVLSDSRIHNRTSHPWSTGYKGVSHRISVRHRQNEIRAANPSLEQKAHPLLLTSMSSRGNVGRSISGYVFSLRRSGPPVLTDIVDMPLPSSKCSLDPFSSLTHTHTRRDPNSRTVSNVESRVYTSLEPHFNHQP